MYVDEIYTIIYFVCNTFTYFLAPYCCSHISLQYVYSYLFLSFSFVFVSYMESYHTSLMHLCTLVFIYSYISLSTHIPLYPLCIISFMCFYHDLAIHVLSIFLSCMLLLIHVFLLTDPLPSDRKSAGNSTVTSQSSSLD